MRALVVFVCTALAACGTVDRQDPGGAENGVAMAGSENPPIPAGEATSTNSGEKPGGSHAEKPSAPVTIEGKLDGSHAALEIVFEANASDVSIEVWGVDGLVVTSAKTPIQNRSFNANERVAVDVSFTAPATRADLAVSVRGTFAGRERARVRSFTVNASAPSLTPAPGDVRTGPDGRPVRVMKSQ
jgi:hypothetical protein